MSSYDSECLKLAQYFLGGTNLDITDAHANLAKTIQAAVEQWLDERRAEFSEAQDAVINALHD